MSWVLFLSFQFSNVFVPVETVILGCFLVVFWPEFPKIFNFVWTLDQWWHARWCIRYATIFIAVLRNHRNWAKKLTFRLIFTLQDFVKWKTLLRDISGVSFDQRYSPNKVNTAFEKSFKSLDFDSNTTQIYSFSPKILLKIKISGKPSSLRISNNISRRSQKKSHNSCKINQSKFFGPKLGINCSLRLGQRDFRNSHIAYSRAIQLYFLDTKFQFLGICCSRLHLDETTFFCSGPNWTRFFIFYFIPFYSIYFLGW